MANQINHTQPPAIIRRILERRGIDNLESQKAFLFPSLSMLPAPELMLNLDAAADLAIDYLLNQKKIIIWGDYDVDGTTGTALLVLFFRVLGLEAIWYIPNRLQEGYGLNLDWFLENQAEIGSEFLLITVDCGTGDSAAIAQIQAMGGEVIVTDHHLIPRDFKPKCLLVNPSQERCGFHHHCLAGVGVAFYLAAAIRKNLKKHSRFRDIYENLNLKELLPFVALGTLSDIVPLTEVNRVLIRAGMEAIRDCKIPGLKTLLRVCEVESSEITSEDVGYLLGPKINAAGRLGESRVVVELFTEANETKTKELASTLLQMNNERKAISDNSLEIALANLSESRVLEDKCILALGNYHKGVAGIVASRLVEYYKVPVLILCDNNKNGLCEPLVGSARSIENVNILDIFKKCSRYLEKFGGHSMAAGLTIMPENCEAFIREFKNKAKLAVTEIDKKPLVQPFDANCTIDELLQDDVMTFYKLLEPFGPKNPQPVFRSSSSLVIDSRTVGNKGSHLSVTFRTRYSKIKGIGFNLGDRLQDVQNNPDRKILFTPTLNRFRGTTSWQLRLISI